MHRPEEISLILESLTFCVPIILLVKETAGHLDHPESTRGLEHHERLREGTSSALLWAVRSMECRLPIAFWMVCFLQDYFPSTSRSLCSRELFCVLDLLAVSGICFFQRHVTDAHSSGLSWDVGRSETDKKWVDFKTQEGMKRVGVGYLRHSFPLGHKRVFKSASFTSLQIL